ncbi:MAG: heavy-metal-associated domain-containing protein [Actinobacteria bacterium]|nr:heavy-metal-associated domain-containing protein [Actinomycetota bacterium]
MTCGGCERRVEKVLGRLDGVRSATADHGAGQVRIVVDPARTSVGAVVDAITTAGYDVALPTGEEDR